MIDKEILSFHNLTQEEYKRIVEFLGREPNYVELGVFSVMWSEHCSYKSSKVHLKKLPTKGDAVIQGPGENAGVVDIGDGLVLVFKIESHNHPSFIEPYQGAATGVGGIVRDIFTMGARPIALMDSLRFGPLEEDSNRLIMNGVVSGIAGYGNSIGVPTVGGETYFHRCYSTNPLVNVFCIGIAKKEKIFFGRALGDGNPVLYAGAKTGRDGIHGATMASAEFKEDSEEKRPNVQVGDPFKEKLLIEACLEVMEKDLIVGIQDMGAGGLTSSSAETAGRAMTGIFLNLDHVPLREEGMTPYEILLSESQERMLLIGKKGKEKEIQEIFKKWDLECSVIGEVRNDGFLTVTHKGEIVCRIPVKALVSESPVYKRPYRKRENYESFNEESIPFPSDFNEIFLRILSSPNIAHKGWIFTQYDHMVQTNTALLPGADSAVLWIKGTEKGIAITLDGNMNFCYLNPRTGAKLMVAEALRNISCAGAKPLGATNCLNFGNPEKEEIMWEFKEVIEGMAEACEYFKIPITGGNVSFYNETSGKSIYPTPVFGLVGIIEEIKNLISPGFKGDGKIIALAGKFRNEIGGSEYLKIATGKTIGKCPEIDLSYELRLHRFMLEIIKNNLIESAHDLSEGGLAVCLAECAFFGENGFNVNIEKLGSSREDFTLFGESPTRIVISFADGKSEKIVELAKKWNIDLMLLGKTGGKSLKISKGKKLIIDIPLKEGKRIWMESIEEKMNIPG
ncbi:MAG: phosphoribosylformylglycinamidine synthase subunit PurL [Candidatus Aminicenantia bacterium]